MASLVKGWETALYSVCIIEYAKEYAYCVAGHPLLDKGFDKKKFDAAVEDFKARIDTPEKLVEWGMALDRAERGED